MPLLQDYVSRQAELQAEAVAISMGQERLTYGEIEEQSNQLARLLRAAGCRRGDRICLLAPKKPETIMSMIGVLKADCAYVPIDTSSPAQRIALIVRSADPKLILATSSTSGLLDEILALEAASRDVVVATLDEQPVEGGGFRSCFTRADVAREPAGAVTYANSGEDPAHILFTSGSTGVPKGVVIAHDNVVSFVDWGVRYFGITASDRLSGHTPLHFDLSTFDIYGTFCAGAQLYPTPPALNAVPHRLSEMIRRTELTQWFSVPSMITFMTAHDVLRNDDFPALRRVLFCGEVLPTPTLIHWMEHLPHVQFTNLYGPTEATIASSYYTVPECPALNTEPIPIGTACSGEELLVLDEELKPVPDGEIGDLYIGGVGLSPRYWRDEEKTRAAFVPDPRADDPGTRIYRTGDLANVGSDGLVYFHGRADSQIKSRGYRIELGEIETALNALEFLQESAVVGVETGSFEGTVICCAYAPVHESIDADRLTDELRPVLPGYMIPTRWLSLGELPKNVNGKIDRRVLKEHFAETAVLRAGASE